MRKSLVIAILVFNSLLLANASLLVGFSDLKGISFSTVNSYTTVTDFSEFSILENTVYINSDRTNTSISFEMLITSLDEVKSERHYMPFRMNYGSGVDFTVSIELDYKYSGTRLRDLYFKVGSSKSEDGNTVSAGTSESVLCYCGIIDDWAGSSGSYALGATPNDSLDHYSTSPGTIDLESTVKLFLSRSQNVVTCRVEKAGVTQLSHTWSNGLTRNVSYISVEFSGNPTYVLKSEGMFHSINGQFEFVDAEKITYTIDTYHSIGYIAIFSVLGMIILISRKVKK